MPLKRIVFIRGGETDWNYRGRWQGWVASPLNELGQQQMLRLSSFIRHLGLSQLYSSDTRRASQSAKILADRLGFEPIFDERLRERHIGIFQGLTVPEIHGWYPREYSAWLAEPENYRIPNGESMREVRARVLAALSDMMRKVDQEASDVTVGILSHTSTIRLIIKELTPELDLSKITFANASVSTLAKDNESWRLVQVNDLSHLEGLESRYMPEDLRGDDIDDPRYR